MEMWGVSEPFRAWVVTGSGAAVVGLDELQTHLQLVDQWEAEDRARLFGGIDPGIDV